MIYQKSHFALLVRPSDQSKRVEVTVTVAAINNAEVDEAVEFRIQPEQALLWSRFKSVKRNRNLKRAFIATGESTLGMLRTQRKEWISDETCEKIGRESLGRFVCRRGRGSGQQL